MKKIPGLVIFLTHLACISFSQDQLTFKIAYKPTTRYNQIIKQTSKSELTYSGTEEFLKQLQEKGIQNPTITNTESTIESVLNTGKMVDDIHFPVTMTFVKTARSDGKNYVPDGTIIYGKGTAGKLPTLDSISSAGLSEDFKNGLLQSMRGLFSQILFPEMTLKVGEEFSDNTPLTIPFSDFNIEMTITSTYKLMSIENGLGNFNITQIYKMKSTISKYEIQATGNGKGSFQYDISNTNYLNYQLDTDMAFNMKVEEFKLNLVSRSAYIQSTIISKN